MSGVWVVLEERDGRIGRISWEAVAAGQKLAAQLGLTANAILPGAQTASLAAEAATKALGKVVRLEHPLLAAYTPDGSRLPSSSSSDAEQPDYVVFPHTYQVRDYAPALAARMGQVLIGDVVAIGAESGHPHPVFTRPLMQGRMNGEYRHAGGGPCFVSVQSGAFRAESAESGAAAIETFTPT